MRRGAFLSSARVTVLLSLASLLLAADPALAQHELGVREQWQPQFSVGGWDADRRLHAAVTLDMLGRSAASTLAELSEQTGVSLQIAPKDIDTVGERKLSLFVRGGELKSVMVQIPEALRECHWDIDKSGPQPVYYLHRNAGGADLAGGSEREMERLRDPQRTRRVERLEAVKRALAMSPEELKEFENEDLFLALAMQDPDKRADAALFLALPPEQLQGLVDTGRVQPRYEDLSPELKDGFERLLGRHAPPVRWRKAGPPGPEEQETYDFLGDRVSRWREGPDPRVDFVDAGERRLGVGLPGIFLSFPIPPRFPTERDRSEFASLLERAGTPASMADVHRIRADADRTVSEWIEKGRVAQVENRDSSQHGPGNEPTDPALLQSVTLQASGPTEPAQLQRQIAGETGLNLISDYFSERPIAVSGSLRQPMPLWRLLSVLSAERECIWRKTGSYLVFHHVKWYGLSLGEIPERLLIRYRQKVAEVGHLTIADAAEFAVEWKPKDMRAYGIPMDLQEAGLGYPSSHLLLYAELSPEQIADAHRPAGLPCRELSAPQRRRLADVLAKQLAGPSITMDQAIARGSFHIEETVTKPDPSRRLAGRTDVHLFVQLDQDRPRFINTHGFPEIARPPETADSPSR